MANKFEEVRREAESLGFVLEDREWDADNVVEDEDGKEREVREHCRAYKVTFPSDYSHPPLYVDKDDPEEDTPGMKGCQVRSLRQIVHLYHNRFEEYRKAAEWNEKMAEATERLRLWLGGI